MILTDKPYRSRSSFRLPGEAHTFVRQYGRRCVRRNDCSRRYDDGQEAGEATSLRSLQAVAGHAVSGQAVSGQTMKGAFATRLTSAWLMTLFSLMMVGVMPLQHTANAQAKVETSAKVAAPKVEGEAAVEASGDEEASAEAATDVVKDETDEDDTASGTGDQDGDASTPSQTSTGMEPGTQGSAGAATSSRVGSNAGNAIGAGSYAVRLRGLEREVGELKDQVFRSKARLALVAENVVQGAVAGSQIRLRHVNRMSSAYRLTKVIYMLDGAPVYEKVDEREGLDEQEAFDAFRGSVLPGEHTLTVVLEYVGRGYGVFSYMKGYRFRTRATHVFGTKEGVPKYIKVVGYEKGGAVVPVEDRPAIRFAEEDKSPTGEREGAATSGRVDKSASASPGSGQVKASASAKP